MVRSRSVRYNETLSKNNKIRGEIFPLPIYKNITHTHTLFFFFFFAKSQL